MRNCSHLSSNKVFPALSELSISPRVLESTKLTAYYSFNGPQNSWAQLQMDSSELVPTSAKKLSGSVSMSVGIVGGEIAPRLLLTATVREDRRSIHNGSLNFFPDGTMDARNEIFDPIFTKHKDDKVTDKDFSGVYKLTFQSDGGIGSELNLEQKHQ